MVAELIVKGRVVLLDEEDLHLVEGYKWRISPRYGYVMSFVRHNGQSKSIYMHRIILGVTGRSNLVDHINHNRLDNRKCNLRITDYKGNARNKTSHKNSSSKYLGVSIYLDDGYKCIVARIFVDGKNINLGHFKTEEMAAKSYNEAAVKHFGEFANLNII